MVFKVEGEWSSKEILSGVIEAASQRNLYPEFLEELGVWEENREEHPQLREPGKRQKQTSKFRIRGVSFGLSRDQSSGKMRGITYMVNTLAKKGW